MRRIVGIALLFTAAGIPAGAQGVAGKWSAMFDSDITQARDTFVVKSRSAAKLALTQKGDSVHGTWGDERQSVAVHGTFNGKTLTLTTGLNEREVRINGQATRMKTRTDFSATVTGNTLAGTMFIRFGDREPPPRRWEAKR